MDNHLPQEILYYLFFVCVVMEGQLRCSTCWAQVLLLNCVLNSNSLYFALFFGKHFFQCCSRKTCVSKWKIWVQGTGDLPTCYWSRKPQRYTKQYSYCPCLPTITDSEALLFENSITLHTHTHTQHREPNLGLTRKLSPWALTSHRTRSCYADGREKRLPCP